MRILSILTIVLAISSAACAADDDASKMAKKQADEVSQAFVKADYTKIVDLTYSGLIDFVGGRDKLIGITKGAMEMFKQQGIEVTSYKMADPGEIVKGEGKSYVVVPATMELKAPVGKIKVKSYLLGISTDDGKSWKFLDGSGLANKELKDKIVPNLPAKLKLPEQQQPEVTKE
jgi:hypothetical protein